MRSDDDKHDRGAAHLDRGWDLAMDGDVEGARRAAEKALSTEGETPEVHTLIGYIDQLEGKLEDALRHYTDAIRFDDLYLDALIRATEVLFQLGRREEGMTRAAEALELCETPDERADVMLLQIDALIDAGEMEEAASIAAALPEGPFESPQIPFHVGRTRFDVGDVDGAEAMLLEAKERDAANPDVHYYLGLLHEHRGETRLATLSFLHSLTAEARLEPPPGSLSPEQFEKRLRSAMKRLREDVSAKLEDTLIVPTELPGFEVVAEGVDPRVPVLMDDAPADDGSRRIVRLFVYQRNLERVALASGAIVDEIVRAIEREMSAIFPELDLTNPPDAS